MIGERLQTQVVDPAVIAELRSSVRGAVIEPGDAEYDLARHVYNAMIERHPAVIIRCHDVADVMTGVNFAREQDLVLSVRSGGHNVTGFGTNDGGVVLDLGAMNTVRIDPEQMIAHVSGGAMWGDLDHAAWAFGLATPGGVISTTGVAGLGLGGGFGHLTRQFGLVIDNMLEADVVTADGRFVHASATEHPDLFWALRGGGGNFGVVTHLTLRLHDVAQVYGGPIFYPLSEQGRVLRFYRDFMRRAPRNLSAFFGIHIAPPAPFVPEPLQGHLACAIVPCFTGPAEEAEAMIRPIRDAAPVALDLAGPIPYPVLNSLFDDLLPRGLHHYWKADFVHDLSDAVIAEHEHWGHSIPTFQSLVHVYPLDGAVHDVPADATAFAHRDVNFVHIIAGIDTNGERMGAHRDWVRQYWSALHPHSAGSAYVNFLMDEGAERVQATYSGNYPRLRKVKHTWDPGNLFRMNQNIPPEQ